MTSRKEWFHKYEPVFGGSVFMGDDHALEIAGIGTIKLKMFDGTVCTFYPRDGIIKVSKGALVVMKAKKIAANLYMLKGEAVVASDNLLEESTMMWHQKLGHMTDRGLKILTDQHLLPRLKRQQYKLREGRKEEIPVSSEATIVHDEQDQAEFSTSKVRRSTRERRQPSWHSDSSMEGNVAYRLLTEDGEPLTYYEVMKYPDASLWMTEMQEEIEALHKNKTWELVSLSQRRKAIGNKWVYKIKRDSNNQVERYRALD
ncbi:PREDICTED: uncharacterized protein LOC109174726 [Ipomoea nil]|uniref:uncharacterized protein LOC109174726 n=1 Tax=Ipomoea nil TaxID=35883 RepID=UPI0009012EF9|nr:PREDICTED: uncharacterized protein LOC109174726 [Ipomoea nil]